MPCAFTLLDDGGIQVVLPNDEYVTFASDHERWDEITEACRNDDAELLQEIYEWTPKPPDYPVVTWQDRGVHVQISEGEEQYVAANHPRWRTWVSAIDVRDPDLMREWQQWKPAPKFIAGEMVFFTDPDGGVSSGVYEVSDIVADGQYMLDERIGCYESELSEPTFSQIMASIRAQIEAERKAKPTLLQRLMFWRKR